ncbi:unnamed protein product [Cuscuta campestris]|uniref:At1g61320/AtMIF1 LRR domain-containing protein n=1 Tax=Cuscuta campestris TaxID=132261 RepID=A0A484K6W7_9ASTE|nr:unnamed protein product [Cuscuta campestris]
MGLRNLLRYQSSNVERLKIHFYFDTRFANDVDTWIWFATERNVRDLRLSLSYKYSLPQSLYSYSSLTNVSLSCCRVEPKGGISWESLKSLSMDGVTLDENTIAKLFLGCPCLEFLKFQSCDGFTRLDVRSDSLRELVIERNYHEMSTPLEISSPKLQHLHIVGIRLEQVRLTDVSSLVKAKLKLKADTSDYSSFLEEHSLNCIKLLESMHNVIKLELELWEFQAILFSEVKPSASKSPPFTCLKISKYNSVRDVFGIIALLQCLPNLETLVVNDVQRSYYSDSPKSISVSGIGKIPLPYLKTVKFHGFKSLEEVDEDTLKLAKLLLKNAEHLERIVINVGEHQMVLGPHAA